jgi:mutator protein MutT
MKVVAVAIAVLHRGGRFFLQRRDPSDAVLPGLWEFPGGKLRAEEGPEAALRRELLEEIQWTPLRVETMDPIEHLYPERFVRLHPFLCEGDGQPRTALAWGWFDAAELRHLPVPAANAPLIELLSRWPQ